MFRLTRSCLALGAVVAVLFVASPAQASTILPGQTISPVPFAGGCPCSPLLALTFGAPWSISGALNGSFNAAVYDRDPGAGVLLDFYYQVGVSANSTSLVNRLTMSNFAGWATDVFYYDPGGNPNLVAPSSADRTASGATVGFDFDPAITGNGVSYVVVVRTDASAFTTGSWGISGVGGSTTVDAYQPFGTPGTPAVPEPASLLLLGTGVVALRRRLGRR